MIEIRFVAYLLLFNIFIGSVVIFYNDRFFDGDGAVSVRLFHEESV